MTECYTEEALDRYNSVKKELIDYQEQNFDTRLKSWIKVKESTGVFVKCDKAETEKHQAKVRELKQQMEVIAQESLINNHASSQAIADPALKAQYEKIAPLFYRRRNYDTVKKILSFNFNADGDLFTFSDPTKISTKYLYCGCGFVTKDAVAMTEAEALLAEEHLKVCQFVLEEVKEEYSAVSKHTIGRWDCKACYTEPINDQHKGIATDFEVAATKTATEWCPKFLRPFRSLTPANYLASVKGKSCYGGILHKQISIALEKDGKQYLVTESMCDTCGYGRSDKHQIIIPGKDGGKDSLVNPR